MNTASPCIDNLHNLVPSMRASLQAKMFRLLHSPVIGQIAAGSADQHSDPESSECKEQRSTTPSMFVQLAALAAERQPSVTPNERRTGFIEDPKDGSCHVVVVFDYDTKWKGREKEILEAMQNTIEEEVVLLTDSERNVLEKSPAAFVDIEPRPVSAELIGFETEWVGNSQRVVKIVLATKPENTKYLKHIAIIPNLIPLQRQLSALRTLESAKDDSVLKPLRALVGLQHSDVLYDEQTGDAPPTAIRPMEGEQLDEFQLACVRKALATPHFAVIEGPPGSGKTTVISAIIRRLLDSGQRVLVASPTHVAVDNVVEKLAQSADSSQADLLDSRTIPVRFASRNSKLSSEALRYWVGPKKQHRAATIARRLENCLTCSQHLPEAASLFARLDPDADGRAPLSSVIAGVESVICGTPLGIQSHPSLKGSSAASFDVLVIDEVSKMTLPEFLAIAVYARRWILVGDPAQLPPFSDANENAETLNDVLGQELELVCSVGALVERTPPHSRGAMRLVVVAKRPDVVMRAIRAHIESVGIRQCPALNDASASAKSGVVVCAPGELKTTLHHVRSQSLSKNTPPPWLLLEKPWTLPQTEPHVLFRLVENRQRAAACLFENAFNAYHARPWGRRMKQKLRSDQFRNGMTNYLPSVGAVLALAGAPLSASIVESEPTPMDTLAALQETHRVIAERYAVNTISVYDWLTGIPSEDFDVDPLARLPELISPGLVAALAPHVGRLKKQYRMHPSISAVPRKLFYFGEALLDGKPVASNESRVKLMQVDGQSGRKESNQGEVNAILKVVNSLVERGSDEGDATSTSIMIITPYSEQERLLRHCIEPLLNDARGGSLNIEVSTLDRCQGREADYVFISLVKSKATIFMDMPKRWNVALTRAKEGLFIVGDIDAFLGEAQRESLQSSGQRRGKNPKLRSMSLLARILEEYNNQQ